MTTFEYFEQSLTSARALGDTIPKRSLQAIVENAYGIHFHNNCWKVIGITEACLRAFAENDFKSGVVKAQRAHLFQRRETYMNVIYSDMTANEALQYIADRDISLMALRSENKDDNSLINFAPIDPNDGYFPSASIGYTFRNKIEGQFLRQLAEQYL